MTDYYELHRLQCAAATDAWERAAETARVVGDLVTAHHCNDNAIRCRWLAEPEDDLRELFNGARAAIVQNHPEVPRD